MVKIIADTTSSIPVEQAKQLGIYYLPQIIIFDEQSYRDDSEIDTATFLKMMRSSRTLPKTAAPPPALYTLIFKELAIQGETGVVICPSGEVSGTFRSATVAAQDFPDVDIRIIDTQTLAGGLASIVLKAQQWANQGLDADTIEAKVKEMAGRQRIYFVVDTLEYLYKGGRIGGAQALFGSILQVKPILTLKAGRAEPVESQRTKRRALSRARELVISECPQGEEACLSIMYGENDYDAKCFIEEFSQALNLEMKDIPFYELPPAILVHAGPGVIGISFFTKSPTE